MTQRPADRHLTSGSPVSTGRRLVWRLAASISILGGMGCSAMASEPLPASFAVDRLAFRLSLQDGNAAYAPKVVTLSDAEGGRLEASGRSTAFRFGPADRVALLNALIEVRFFDLPTAYAKHAVARLAADGSVRMVDVFTSNAESRSVCVSIAAFEKCVRYGLDAPPGLDRVVRGVLADAERLTGKP